MISFTTIDCPNMKEIQGPFMQREGFLASTFLIDIPRVMDTVYCARLD
jgi:hypothetical protein